MDACSRPGLLPVTEAIEKILAALQPVTAAESVPLLQSLDRVLAQTLFAPINVPGADNSAMDGYAIRQQDAGSLLNIIGESFAGHPFTGVVGPNQCVRIMTGAVLPEAADAVVMQENVTRDGHQVRVNNVPQLGENIRRAGEDIAQHSQVLAAGRLLTALDIGLLASLGIPHVDVFKPVKVALLTTGDELLGAGATATPGKIFDSNRPLLAALLQRLPVELLDLGIIPDQPDALRNAFATAQEFADLVISTGGVSVGDADYTGEILAERGEISFWKIAMKPGKPFAFGALGNNARGTGCWFCGLPGNPVSTAVTYHQLVVPALRYLAGEVPRDAVIIKATTSAALKKQPGRMDFQRGIFRNLQGLNCVESVGSQSSGVLSSMTRANCLIRLEADRGPVSAGELVDVILFDQFIQ